MSENSKKIAVNNQRWKHVLKSNQNCSSYLRVLQQLLFASYEQWVNNPLKKFKQNLFANGKIAITGL